MDEFIKAIVLETCYRIFVEVTDFPMPKPLFAEKLIAAHRKIGGTFG